MLVGVSVTVVVGVLVGVSVTVGVTVGVGALNDGVGVGVLDGNGVLVGYVEPSP